MPFPIRPFTEGMVPVPQSEAALIRELEREVGHCLRHAREMRAVDGPPGYVASLVRRARRMRRLSRALRRAG